MSMSFLGSASTGWRWCWLLGIRSDVIMVCSQRQHPVKGIFSILTPDNQHICGSNVLQRVPSLDKPRKFPDGSIYGKSRCDFSSNSFSDRRSSAICGSIRELTGLVVPPRSGRNWNYLLALLGVSFSGQWSIGIMIIGVFYLHRRLPGRCFFKVLGFNKVTPVRWGPRGSNVNDECRRKMVLIGSRSYQYFHILVRVIL